MKEFKNKQTNKQTPKIKKLIYKLHILLTPVFIILYTNSLSTSSTLLQECSIKTALC